MASTSRKAPATKLILTPVMTLRGHEGAIPYLSYFPDGQRLISGSWDKTGRQWDLKAGKEIEEARDVCEKEVYAVAVSRNGRWIVSAGGRPELKACEIEKGIVRKFEGHSWLITCIDISADSTLLASGAKDFTARIWSLDTAKLVAGPFESLDLVGAVRFSTGSKKLAVQSHAGTCLEVWDVRSQKLDVRIGKSPVGFLGTITCAPVFWTNQNQNILAAFTFSSNDHAKTIYEFDATTLETVGVPFEGHTERVIGLALSFDGALLASAAEDDSIKLWAFRSRQVLACFDIKKPNTIVFSPDSRQLACTTSTKNNYKICIFNTPLDVLIRTGISARKKSTFSDLRNSGGTRRSYAGYRKQPISVIPIAQRPPPATDSQQPSFVHKFLRFASRTNTVPPVHPVQPRNPLDVPATLPLPSSVSGQAATQFNHFEISSPPPPSNGVTQFVREHLSFFAPRHRHMPPVVEVAPGRKVTRLVAANLPEYVKVDDTRQRAAPGVPEDIGSSDNDSLPDVHWCKAFLCYYSCWSHGRLRMPPRWRLERIDRPRQDGSRTGAHARSN